MFRTSTRLFRNVLRFSEAATESTTTGLHFKFVSPTTVVFDKPVYSVTLPTVTGDVGILANHVPTIAQVRPGLVIVSENETEPGEKFFVPGGFAVMDTESVLSLTVSEAIPVADIDAALVEDHLSAATANLSSATTEEAKAECEVSIEVYNAMKYCVEMK